MAWKHSVVWVCLPWTPAVLKCLGWGLYIALQFEVAVTSRYTFFCIDHQFNRCYVLVQPVTVGLILAVGLSDTLSSWLSSHRLNWCSGINLNGHIRIFFCSQHGHYRLDRCFAPMHRRFNRSWRLGLCVLGMLPGRCLGECTDTPCCVVDSTGATEFLHFISICTI